MTDPTTDAERAERIRRLQARRSATASAGRKRRPAAATRWLLGGLSVASFFAIAGAVAVADQTNVATTPAAPANAPKAHPGVATPASSQTTSTTPAPAPHTTTRGS